MTKVRLKDATKELTKGAGNVLEEATRVKRGAESLMQQLRKLENQFVREEEQRRAQQKLEEQQRLAQQHTKAWTMPDEDEAPIAAPVKEAAKPQVAKKEAASEKTEQSGKDAKAAKPQVAPAIKAENKEEAPKAEPVAEVEKKAAAPAEKKEEKVETQALPGAQAESAAQTQPVKPQEKPAAQAQPVARPMQGAAQPRNAAPGQPRPQYGRPANPAQGGPYGRPANPAAQGGPYGRPANPAAQGGPYGRPANPAQGGPYGRPANPAAQGGPYGRPANPAQGGPYGRPANAAQGGFTPRPGMGGARPQGQGGFAPRPGGAPGGRPGMGGAPGGRPGMGGSAGGGRPGMGRSKGPELTPVVEKERVSNYDPNKKSYIRQHDPERMNRSRRQMNRGNYNGYDDDMFRGRKARNRKPSAQMMMAPIKIEKAYMTAETITVKDLTERIGKPAGEILKKLILLGIMATINSELDFDTASLVCSEFDIDLEMKMDKTAEDYLSDEDFKDTEDNLETRPPVITIMGHVDHGKTSLLDYIRKSRVTTGEAGGITQHIGAYTVELADRQITFLDTPGHEAFTAMRARGTQATDIAVLVVAADDGVMPQTVESINHAKAAGVPIIVAINKMDKEAANPERIKQDLTAYSLVPEEWGGDTIVVPVSALNGDGVDSLLEMILLQSEILQLQANPNRKARGVIIEAKLDKSRGPVATVLVQNGTLRVGDNVVAGMASGRVRAMVNDRGQRVTEVGPSMPVEVAGFNEVPSAGDDMMAVGADHLSRQVAQERRDKQKAARVAASSKVTLDNLFSHIDAGKMVNLNLIIKADVQGSVEAVKQALEKLSNDEVKVRILHSAVGAISQDDVNLASAFDAIIVGFNVRPDNSARDIAERENIDLRLYRVIYQAIEDIQKAMKGLLAPEYKEVILGHAEVRSTFKITGSGMIAGCYVLDGKMQRNEEVRLLRDNVVVFEGKLSSLKRFKDDVKDVATGYECGASLEGHNDIKEGDIIECFTQEEIER